MSSDKTKSIKNATDKELDELIIRLRKENELQSLVLDLKRRATVDRFSYDNPPQVSTEEPIESLYHYGTPGMKWGRRKASGDSSKESKHERKAVEKQLKNEARKEKILRSPSKLYKHRNEFTKEEIESAMRNMKMERELRSLSRDEITSGAQYANSILMYANTAAAAYNLSKSPAGQAALSKLKK